MATIKNLIIRIGVTDTDVTRGVNRVNNSLKSMAKEADKATASSNRFSGLLSKTLKSSLSKIATTAVAASKGLAVVAFAAGGLNTAVQAGTALAPLAGALALLPAAALGAAVALNTLKLATSGMGDAIKLAMTKGADPKKFAAALKDLAPAARNVVLELHKLQPVLLGIRNAAQQALFAPLQGQLTAIVKTLAGPLRQGVTDVASAFGLAGQQVAVFARQADTAGLVRNAFNTVAISVRSLAPAIQPVLAGFRSLAQVGLSFFPQMASSAGNLATKFGLWLQQIVATGKAAQWIRNALATFKQLFGVVGQLGGILKSVFSAASSAGSNFLGVLGAALSQLNAFLKTSAGKSALQSIFQGLATIGTSLGPVIGALVTQVGTLAGPIGRLAALVGPILTVAINALGPALAALEPGFKALFGALGQAITAIAPALVPLGQALSVAVQALAPLLPLAGSLAGALGTLLASALRTLAPLVAPIVKALSTSLMPVLPQLTGALVQLVTALTPLMAALGTQFAGVIAQLVPQIGTFIVQFVQGIIPAFNRFLTALVPLIPQLVQLATQMLTMAVTSLPQLLPLMIDLVTALLDLATAVLPLAPTIIRFMLAMLNILSFGPVIKLLIDCAGAIDWLVRVVAATPGKILDALNWIIRNVPKAFSSAFHGAYDAVKAVSNDMLRFIGAIPGVIGRAFSGAGKWLWNAGKAIITGLWNGIASMVSWLGKQLGKITHLIPSWKGPMSVDLRLLEPSGAAIMTGLVSGITKGAPLLHRALSGVTNSIAGAVSPGMSLDLATPSGVAAVTGSAAAGGASNASAIGAAVKAALVGVGVNMDGKPVGAIVSKHLGRDTDLRRRSG